MLSSALRSPRAIAMNVLIMRAFVRLRRMQSDHAELRQRLEELEKRIGTELSEIWEVLDALENPPAPPRRPLGFRPETKPEGAGLHSKRRRGPAVGSARISTRNATH
jgi:hypothetical protein